MSNNQGNPQTSVPDIRHTVVFQAPIEKVWNAVSTSEGIAVWLMPNTFERTLGHEFTLESTYGTSYCKVTELEPPHRLAFTWGEDWIVSFELKDLGGSTEFTLVHSGWKAAEAVLPQARETTGVVRDRMNHGWGAVILPRLGQFVEA
ncbi:SRPBCC domain-containing protein [Paenibacillus filicis]|uniref:SRPBCC domain-containing protein n=1 Tax=Paenibacillus gyeongsangnamensis TaxID=3388067 RepID=A0ABT4QFU9_9BACL|nr:SRPBCC domain-containing protein [Paenibacillus filicis]MCZ8515760.1 SRPBCC domain-containing protein [Paenibacillus filicis]